MSDSFGGKIELTGESEYRQALTKISQNLRVVSAEMKATSTGFASGDKSTKDLTNASKTLNEALSKQKSALESIKKDMAEMQSKYAEAEAKHSKLVSTYEKEKSKLAELESTLGKSSTEYAKQEKVVASLESEVAKSTTEFNKYTKNLNDMRIKTANAEATSNKTAKTLNELGKKTQESGEKAKISSTGFTVMKGVLANLASSAITSALNGIRQLGGTVVNVGKQALDSYGDYEQLVGGVDTLFGKSSKKVQEYASNAYKTAGLSANEYMDTVTSFSASLLQGLNGDTKKASKVANLAVTDMSDNANKMGTDMKSIQNAYQGFAKQNYTMLDNLKLGYGGTKSEMARLVKDSGILGKAGKDLTAKNLDQKVSYDQMIEAIHKVQTNMGITGTTSKEASTTIQGSVNSMKSAWQNMLTGMADENADFGNLAKNFASSLVNVVKNIAPRLTAIISGMVNMAMTTLPTIFKKIAPLIEKYIPTVVNSVKGIIDKVLELFPIILPKLAEFGVSIIDKISELIPNLVEKATEIMSSLASKVSELIPKFTAVVKNVIDSIASALNENAPSIINDITQIALSQIDGLIDIVSQNLPTIIDTGVQLITSLADGIVKAIPKLIEKVPKIITSLINTLLASIPKIVDAGVKLLTSITKNLPKIISSVVKAIPRLITGLLNAISSNIPKLVESGFKLLTALVKNLPKIIIEVVKAVPQIIKSIVKGIVDAVPQMAGAGLNLIKGLWEGLNNAKNWLLNKIKSLMGSVIKGIKKFFGIHSPSKKMRDEVGVMLAKGVVEGVKKEQKNTIKEINKSSSESLKKLYKKRSELQAKLEKTSTKKNKESVKKQIETVNSSIEEAQKKANSKTSAQQSKLDEKIISGAKTRASELKKSNKLSEAQEVDYWKQIAKTVKKGSKSYKSAIAQMQSAKKTLKKDVTSLTKTYSTNVAKINKELQENIAKLQQTYTETVTKRKEEIMSSFGLFNKPNLDSKITKEDLKKSLKSQVTALTDWDSTLSDLEKKIGRNNPLYQELESMGVSSLKTLQSVNDMTNEELKEYLSLYVQKNEIAQKRATKENENLKASTESQIATLKETAKKQINALTQEYTTDLKALGVTANNQSKSVGKQITAGIKAGLKKGMKDVSESLQNDVKQLVKGVKKQLKIKSPSRVFRDEIGKNMALGLGIGFSNAMQGVSAQMQSSIPTKLDLNSSVNGVKPNGQAQYPDMLSAFKQALGEMTVELDDYEVGKFVNKTVARTIYT